MQAPDNHSGNCRRSITCHLQVLLRGWVPSTQVSQQTKLQCETYPDSDSKKYVQHISIRYRNNECILHKYVFIYFYVVFVVRSGNVETF